MNLLLVLMLMQQVPHQHRQGQQSQVSNAPVENRDAVATFDGVFKSADKKHVYVEVENGQTMEMYITGATKFIREGKPAKPADFQSGDPVTVDSSRDARFNLIAVRVEAAKKETDKKQERQPDK
jgi:hypothetical protein